MDDTIFAVTNGLYEQSKELMLGMYLKTTTGIECYFYPHGHWIYATTF